MKVLVSVKYFLVFWIVKHIQLGPNIQNPLSRMNQICNLNQINKKRENLVNQMYLHMNQINQKPYLPI